MPALERFTFIHHRKIATSAGIFLPFRAKFFVQFSIESLEFCAMHLLGELRSVLGKFERRRIESFEFSFADNLDFEMGSLWHNSIPREEHGQHPFGARQKVARNSIMFRLMIFDPFDSFGAERVNIGVRVSHENR